MHLVYPENFGFCFQFLLMDIKVPREILNIEKNVDAKFWGQTRCIMVYVKIEIQWIIKCYIHVNKNCSLSNHRHENLKI